MYGDHQPITTITFNFSLVGVTFVYTSIRQPQLTDCEVILSTLPKSALIYKIYHFVDSNGSDIDANSDSLTP